MSDERRTALESPQAHASGRPSSAVSDNGAESPAGGPYLKVFGPDIGIYEYALSDRTVAIGRSENADIRLPHPRVSRAHAAITVADGQYTFEDAGSEHGTTVNRKRVERHDLRHGDRIQIGLYLLQYRTHPALPGAVAAAARAKLLLRAEFCLLPSTMRLRYRTLDVAPQDIFNTGDTLRIGHGGLLVPTPNPPGDCACLELHLAWPSEVSKYYLGEIIGVVPEGGSHWMCVKLHTVSKNVHQATVEGSNPGSWIEVMAT